MDVEGGGQWQEGRDGNTRGTCERGEVDFVNWALTRSGSVSDISTRGLRLPLTLPSTRSTYLPLSEPLQKTYESFRAQDDAGG